MDPRVQKLIAHLDQSRSTLREAVEALDTDDVVHLFKDCMSGNIKEFDEAISQMVGMLAAIAIYDLRQVIPDDE